ncbi:MAG: hypothetical protein IPK99_01355 [Flavobacteriales bacterium]|nr:hypothetical protein [Flavobacteriales bacterium]
MPKIWISIVVPVLMGCGGNSTSGRCDAFFVPYPDLISDRPRTPENASLIDAMAAYSDNEFAKAAELLNKELNSAQNVEQIRMYLASCYLGSGRPFDAELQLDFIENADRQNYAEAAEWYTVLCWLCSDQVDRALEGAVAIAGKERHTYKQQAAELAKPLRT